MSLINKLFTLSELSEDVGLHIKVRVYNGKNYIWFIDPLLKDGYHKIQYVVGKKKTTYSQGIRRWMWKEVMFDRSSQVKLPSGEVYKNNGRKWSPTNDIHTSHLNIQNEYIDDKLNNWVKKGGIGKEEKYYEQFVATQKETSQLKDIQLNSVNQSLKERVDQMEYGKDKVDKLEKRVDKLERLVNQLCKMVKGKEEQIQKLKSLVVPKVEPEKPEEPEEPEEPKEPEREKTVTFAEEPKKELPGPITGKAKYLNEDLDWVEFDIIQIFNKEGEDEVLLYSEGEKMGYIEQYQNSTIPEEYRDKDNYVIYETGGERLERLFIDNLNKYYYEVEYNSLVECLQNTNLCEIEYF